MSDLQKDLVEAEKAIGYSLGDARLLLYQDYDVLAVKGRRRRLVGRVCSAAKDAMHWARVDFADRLQDGEVLRVKLRN
jgi:hypothetical protein